MKLIIILVALIALIVSNSFVDKKFVRFALSIALLLPLLVATHSIGYDHGKTNELNRYARSFPDVLNTLKELAEMRDPEMKNHFDYFIEATNSPKRLNQIEITLTNHKSNLNGN